MKRKPSRNVLAAAILAASLPGAVFAQQAAIPHRVEAFRLDSGRHHGSAPGPKATARPAFRETVEVADAQWLRLHFGRARLGPGSFLVLTSRKDGAQQILNARSLREWNHTSAFFNGDKVDVELWVGPGQKGNFVKVRELMVGEPGRPMKTICGTSDNRTTSLDPAVGRIVPVGCTGWVIANGAHLSAGHCVDSGFQTLQFNVPPSLADGIIQHPPPQDQYPIITGSVQFAYSPFSNSIGNDWALFSVQRNSNTGRLPVEVYSGFLRLSRDTIPSFVRVTGYGLDGPASAFGTPPAPRNSDSQTQQWHSGSYLGLSTSGGTSIPHHRYTVDTQGGNSGSPIIAQIFTVDNLGIGLGIHTNGGCTSSGGANRGTSFENVALRNAINAYAGSNPVYVDLNHLVAAEDGTMFRPYDTVTEGTAAVFPGGVVSIVRGNYDVPALTLDRPMKLTAPVGMVTIH
jgi:trimeric autotransporter adhesin